MFDTQVQKGDEVSRYTKVDSDKMLVTKQHVTIHKDDSGNETQHKMLWHFDFSGCTQEQLLELASRDAVIKMRPKFKNCKDSEVDSWDGATFDMAEFCNGKSKADPVERAKKAMSKLSDAEKAALLAELQGSEE